MSKAWHSGERLDRLEEAVAELADIVRHLCWGKHGQGEYNLHARSWEVYHKVAEQVDRVATEVKELKQKPVGGRKFR